MRGVDWGNVTAWLLTGGLLGLGALTIWSFGIFVIPVALVLSGWLVARHLRDAELVVLTLLFAGSLTFTLLLLVLADESAGSYDEMVRIGTVLAGVTGLGFLADIAIRWILGGDDGADG